MRMHPLLAIFGTTMTVTTTAFGAIGTFDSNITNANATLRGTTLGHPATDASALTSRAVGLLVRSELAAAAPLAFDVIIGSRSRLHMLSASERRHAARLVQALSSPLAHLSTAGGASGTWLALRSCESGNDYAANTGNGYFGAYQFAASTWWWIGYRGLPSQASAAVQDQAARALQARVGWGAWPVCSQLLRLG